MSVFPQTYTLTAHTSASTTFNLTPFAIIDPIACEWGIDGYTDLDNLASTGTMTFTLLNNNGYFSPNYTTHLSGWGKGIKIELTIIFDNVTYKRFIGTVNTINLDDANKVAYVTVLDWINYSATFPFSNPQQLINSTADVALTTLNSTMTRPPASISFDVGDNVLPVVFDNPDKKAYTEYKKLANSETGMIYLRHDKNNGEQLVFEKSSHRDGLTLNVYPRVKADCDQGFVLNSTSGNLLNSTGGKIRWLTQANDEATFDGLMTDITPVYGDVINNITVSVTPKTYDDDVVVLFSLPQPTYVASGSPLNLTSTYTNQTTKKTCNAIATSCLSPVAGTDYVAYSGSTTSTTNMTSHLNVSASYTSAEVNYICTDTSGSGLWITTLQCRGRGVYSNTTISTTIEDEASEADYDYQQQYFSQAYQKDLTVGTEFAQKVIDKEKIPQTKYENVTFIANQSNFLMNSFLNCDVGDKINLKSDRYGLDKDFFIQKVKFEINCGGKICFCWSLIR